MWATPKTISPSRTWGPKETWTSSFGVLPFRGPIFYKIFYTKVRNRISTSPLNLYNRMMSIKWKIKSLILLNNTVWRVFSAKTRHVPSVFCHSLHSLNAVWLCYATAPIWREIQRREIESPNTPQNMKLQQREWKWSVKPQFLLLCSI